MTHSTSIKTTDIKLLGSEKNATFDVRLTAIKEVIAILELHKSKRFKSPENSSKNELPFLFRSLRELLLFRSIELATVACSSFEEIRTVSGFTLTRSLIETTAVLYCAHGNLEDSVKAGIINEGTVSFIYSALYGSRLAAYSTIKPTNILTHLSKLDKKSKLLNVYEYFCEFAHPNSLGVLTNYGTIDEANQAILLSNGVVSEDSELGLLGLETSILLFRHYYNGMEPLFEPFSDICKTMDLAKWHIK